MCNFAAIHLEAVVYLGSHQLAFLRMVGPHTFTNHVLRVWLLLHADFLSRHRGRVRTADNGPSPANLFPSSATALVSFSLLQ